MKACWNRTAVLMAGILGMAGCSGASFSFHYDEHHYRPARPTYVRVDHVCTRACTNHYWDGSHVVVLRGHHHGPGCGHYWDGHHWVLRVEKHVSPSVSVHVCTKRCHHYWDGHKLVELTGHVHGPGCGHHWDGRHWVISVRKGKKSAHVRVGPKKVKRRAPHRHSATCGCVYDPHRGTWIRIGKGHRHHRGCGHVFVNGRWTLRD
ncbi:MAG: hypothetical protein D6788_02690 [Planctomycetota bacterium]|nr:MAG: hypothetical protein D6788_02690 [Planctomycetota bacterium]